MNKLSNLFLILGVAVLVLTLVMSVAFLNTPVAVLAVKTVPVWNSWRVCLNGSRLWKDSCLSPLSHLHLRNP